MFNRKSPKTKSRRHSKSFILEPILTPSSIVDTGFDDGLDVPDEGFSLPAEPLMNEGEGMTEGETGFPDDPGLPDGEAEILGAESSDVSAGDPGSEFEEIPYFPDDALIPQASNIEFTSGVFTVGESGEVSIDYLFDGGKYDRGELAIFSLDGMDSEPGTRAFIQEAAIRALSNSERGYVVISDAADAARFSNTAGTDFNTGEYRGVQTFQMRAGDRFGFMLVPNQSIQTAAEGRAWGTVFSMATDNPDDYFQFGQIADVTGDGNTFTLEDISLAGGRSDRDYNDIIFQVRGATADVPLMDEVLGVDQDWRTSSMGRALLNYAQAYTDNVDYSVAAFDAAREFQPLVGIIDTGFAANNPDIDYSNIITGSDFIDGDDNPFLADGEGNEHGTHVLGIIAAQRDNGVGIDGINPDAPIWLGRAVGSGQWANSLVEFVDAAVDSGQPNAVVNLSLDLTQIDADGNVTTRYEFTPQERAAIEYARQNNVLLVVAAGNDGGVMSALGQASQEFDNIITVGAAETTTPELEPFKEYQPTSDSGSGKALDLVADANSDLEGVPSLTVATAKVTGAVSQVWAANPDLNYTQVIDILKRTATDLGQPNWDIETGAGLLNVMAAIQLAKATKPEPYTVKPGRRTINDNFVSSNPGDKPLPGDPTHPAVTPPGIPETTVDTGGNSLKEATQLLMSPTVDIIDQVSSIDPVDVFRMESRYLQGADFSVLDGELSIQYLTPDGKLLGTQVLSKGSHKLELPAGASGEVLMKVERRNEGPATYMLYGFESTEPQPFNIDLEVDSSLTASQKKILEAAAKNVAALIGQGLPTAIVDGKIIDDINIKISGANLDGAGGTQARTKIDFMRYGSLLPAQSLVQFDAADIAELERSGSLFDVAQHEFLHALGFGNLWEAKGLVNYAGTPLAQYNGENAVDAFQAAGGLTDAIALETEGGGSASLHWHQQLFPDEIMTADLNGFTGEAAPISAVTIASLADLGYAVNLDRATPGYQLLGSQSFDGEDLTPEQVEAFRELAEMSFEDADLDAGYEYIAPIMPTVDPDTVAPEIWAHAERFWKNGEYYDWRRYQIRWGDTLSQIALDTMGSAHPDYYWWIANRNGIPDPDYIVTGDWIDIPAHHPNYEWEQEQERLRREAELNQRQEEEAQKRREQEEAFAREQEQVRQAEETRQREAEAKQRELEEQERRLREEMERRRQDEERRLEEARLAELARQAEIARQEGKGGLDWYVAKSLPEFGPVDPFETRLTGETVGNLVPDDYYRFTLSRGGRITAELKQLLADADLVLYDVRNKPIAYSMREGITDEQIIADLIPGTYMLRVNSPKGVTTDYELIVKFKHLLSRTEQGPPPGWEVGGGGGGATAPLFSDPRIMRIYNTALENFAGPERTKANNKIAELQKEKQGYEQDLKALLDKMNGEQRQKVYDALDRARNDARSWVDGIANPIKNTVDSLGNGIKDKADSFANNLLSKIDGIWDLGNGWIKDRKEDARKLIRQGRDAVKTAVNNAQTWLRGQLNTIQDGVKSAISTFFDAVKNAYRTGAEINQAIANAANSFRTAVDRAVRGANELVGKFKGEVLSAVAWTKNLGIKVDTLGVKFEFNAYNQVVEPAVNAIASGASSTINGIGNSLKGITDWLEPRTQKVVADIVNALLGDKTGHLWNKINGVDDKIAATRTGLEKAIKDQGALHKRILDDFLNGLGEAKDFVLGAIFGGFNDEATLLQILFDTVLPSIVARAIDVFFPGVGVATEMGISLAQGIRDLVAELIKSVPKLAKGIALSGGEWFSLIASAVSAVVASIPLTGPYLRSLVRVIGKGAEGAALIADLRKLPVLEDVIEAIGNLGWPAITPKAGDLISTISSAASRALNSLGDGIYKLLSGPLKAAAEAIAPGASNNSRQLAFSVAGGFDSLGSQAPKQAPNAATEIKKVLLGATDQVKRVKAIITSSQVFKSLSSVEKSALDAAIKEAKLKQPITYSLFGRYL